MRCYCLTCKHSTYVPATAAWPQRCVKCGAAPFATGNFGARGNISLTSVTGTDQEMDPG